MVKDSSDPILGGAMQDGSRGLPVLDVQKDIRYHELASRGILNAPQATGMPFWSINPYVGCAFGCAYCYARDTHRYVMERAVAADPHVAGDDQEVLPPWLAFERRVLVKREAARLLRAALREGGRAHQSIVTRGEPVLIGTATDPYQPAERRFQVTRSLLEIFAEYAGLHLGITTKSALITRDAPLLASIAARSRVTVHISLVTLDRSLARLVEPRAPTPDARLRAVRRLREAGLDVGVNCMPVLPGLTDGAAALRALVAAVAAAGATHINVGSLRLRPAARQRYMPWMAESFPTLVPRYQAAYAGTSQPGARYRIALRKLVTRLCAEHGLRLGGVGDPSDEATREAGATGFVYRPPGRLRSTHASRPRSVQLAFEL